MFAVRRAPLYRKFLAEVQINFPDDAGTRGRWTPTIAVDQYAATLASWFGADAKALSTVQGLK